MSVSDDKQADVVDAFNTTFRYLDDILNIDNVYFESMVSQIYPSELQLNKIKKGCKDQESIQSSTTPDPRYQWESDKLTADTTNESQEVSPFPADDHKVHIILVLVRQQNFLNC